MIGFHLPFIMSWTSSKGQVYAVRIFILMRPTLCIRLPRREEDIMAIEKVRAHFAQFGIADRVREFEVSSATVELAAQALNCEPCRIAKTLSLCSLFSKNKQSSTDSFALRFGCNIYAPDFKGTGLICISSCPH